MCTGFSDGVWGVYSIRTKIHVYTLVKVSSIRFQHNTHRKYAGLFSEGIHVRVYTYTHGERATSHPMKYIRFCYRYVRCTCKILFTFSIQICLVIAAYPIKRTFGIHADTVKLDDRISYLFLYPELGTTFYWVTSVFIDSSKER